MNTLFTLHAIADAHALTPEQRARLIGFAHMKLDPAIVLHRISCAAGMIGAVLVGLGIICWIAANWNGHSRIGYFLALQSIVIASCIGAFLRQGGRVALGLVALLSIGALFAFFGQTYQSGGDPWQLFALWAALTLPLCAGVKHDGVWAAWSIVALTAVALVAWPLQVASLHTYPFGAFGYIVGWGIPLLLVVLLGPVLRPYTGAGTGTLRLLTCMSTVMITTSALRCVFSALDITCVALVLLLALGALFCQRGWHDNSCLCMSGLALNIVGFAVAIEMTFALFHALTVVLLVLGLIGMASLITTVKIIMRQARLHARGAAQ